jgi:hypothetical protein
VLLIVGALHEFVGSTCQSTACVGSSGGLNMHMQRGRAWWFCTNGGGLGDHMHSLVIICIAW